MFESSLNINVFTIWREFSYISSSYYQPRQGGARAGWSWETLKITSHLRNCDESYFHDLHTRNSLLFLDFVWGLCFISLRYNCFHHEISIKVKLRLCKVFQNGDTEARAVLFYLCIQMCVDRIYQGCWKVWTHSVSPSPLQLDSQAGPKLNKR